jgi:hypothetical protein
MGDDLPAREHATLAILVRAGKPVAIWPLHETLWREDGGDHAIAATTAILDRLERKGLARKGGLRPGQHWRPTATGRDLILGEGN